MICGDATIDGLIAGELAVAPLDARAKPLAVGFLQDLLRGHGYSSMPSPRAASWGSYGQATRQAVADYRRRNGLGGTDIADGLLLRDLVQRPAAHAVVGPAYIPLVLDVAFTPVLRFVWLTSLFETAGEFARLNLNTDRCGVSFGILQWSQKPGQFHRFLQACCTREAAEWARIMGGREIVDYTAKPNGGVDAAGRAIDRAFELTEDPWKSRLEALGASQVMQRVQLALAGEAYTAELAPQARYAGKISQRAAGFLLDLANQFGGGRVQRHYTLAAQSGATEAEILLRLENEFTALARPQFQAQVRARREFFRTTPLLAG